MELDLKQIGATILIGAFVFLVAEAYLYYFIGVDLTGFFRGRFGFESQEENRESSELSPPIPFTVFIGIAILIGIFAEDLAVTLVESKPQLLALASSRASTSILGSDSFVGVSFSKYSDKPTVRIDEVIAGLNASKQTEQKDLKLETTAIGREMASLHLVHSICDPVFHNGSALDRLQTQLAQSDVCSVGVCLPSDAERDVWRDCLTTIYHTAKNRVYLEPTYFDELERFEVRRHLTASFAVYASLFATPVLLLLLMAMLAPWRRGQKLEWAPPRPEQVHQHHAPPPRIEPVTQTLGHIMKRSESVSRGAAIALAIALFLISLRYVMNNASLVDPARIEPWIILPLLVPLIALCAIEALRPSSDDMTGDLAGKVKRRFREHLAFITIVAGATLVFAVHHFGVPEWIPLKKLAAHMLAGALITVALWIVYEQQVKRAKDQKRLVPEPSQLVSQVCIGAVMTVLFAGISLGSLWANHYESAEESKRVFGYFLTLEKAEQSDDATIANATSARDARLLRGVRALVEANHAPRGTPAIDPRGK